MFKPGLSFKLLTSVWLLWLGLGWETAFAEPDYFSITSVTINYPKDSLSVSDTVKKPVASADTTKQPIDLKHDLIRHADDSIVQDLKHKMVYLYGNADITYGDINIKAAYISVNFNNNILFAKGVKDSTGKLIGTPVFKQGNESFESKTLEYDFSTKKGIITDVRTKQEDGFLQGNLVKREPDNSINIKGGYYTTCDNNPPDYEFRFGRARVIPGKLIVTGPIYMQVEGIPLPLALPFGIFPNNPKRKSGLIMPSYGESATMGFYLQGGGYFWYVNDHLTLKVTGDIYTGGSWKISPVLTYKKRYKYNGSLAFGISKNIIGAKGDPDYSNSRDYKINWIYTQDPKAHPNSSFSANVNIMSSNYVKYNTVNINNYLSNQFNSSISYQKTWGGGKYNLTVAANQSQNTLNHSVSVTLPTASFSVNTFYPFQNKNNPGPGGFLDKLSIGYSLNLSNSITATDSTLFLPGTISRNLQNGLSQSIPISLPLKVFKYFTLSNSINIQDNVFSRSIRKSWVTDSVVNGTTYGSVKTDTVAGFRNAFFYNINSSLSTKLYGLVQFKKGPIRAIRHVMTPSVGFSYTPDFGSPNWGYAGRYIDGNNKVQTYSYFEGGLYSAPPLQKSGAVTFSISNNLEIKVPSKKDTVTGLKIVPLIENFTISGSYNLAADSLKMSNINLSGRTTLWKGLTLQYSSYLNIYAVDSSGNTINKTEWQVNRKLFRMPSSSWNLSLNFSLSEKNFKKKKKENQQNNQNVPPGQEALPENTNGFNQNFPGGMNNNNIDWKIPWSLSFNYTFSYVGNKSYLHYLVNTSRSFVQTLGFSGQINITPKWKISASSGWDFTNNQLSFTQMQIARDLHCWNMSFSWIPIGPRKSWNFTLSLKSNLLKDLKLTKQKDFRENY